MASRWDLFVVATDGDRTCGQCGQRFHCTGALHGRPPAVCSRECDGLRRRAGLVVERECEWCGASFTSRSDRTTRTCNRVHAGWLRYYRELGPRSEPVRTPHRRADMTHLRSPLRAAIEDGGDVVAAVRDRASVADNGCWLWQARTSKGYPVLQVKGRPQILVHRLVLEAHLGRTLGSQPAHHRCGNRVCVNPEHLQPITARENTAEMLTRTYLERRIRELEDALRHYDHAHPLLTEVGLASA